VGCPRILGRRHPLLRLLTLLLGAGPLNEMLEGFATQLVDKYVAPYADVDPDKLRVGVRDGKVVLRDVRLKPEAFDSLGLPLTIREGVIGELEVDVSWKSLRATPVQIRIKDVSVIVGLTNEEQLPQRKAEQMLKEKLEQLVEDEAVRRLRVTPHPASNTLGPTPHTPHPTSHTLHPTPHTPHPSPHTLCMGVD